MTLDQLAEVESKETIQDLKAELAKDLKQFNEKWERKLLGKLKPLDPKKPLITGFRDETVVVPLARLQMWVENQINLLNESSTQKNQGVWGIIQNLNKQMVDSRAGDLVLDIKTEALQKLLKVEDKDLKAEMDTISRQREMEVEVQKDKAANRVVVDRPAQLGDVVKINFVGSVEGKEFAGGKMDNYHLTLGSNTFIPGFEDGVVGMVSGQVKDVQCSFPADYGNKPLAGKDAVFKVTLLTVKEIVKKEESSSDQAEESK